MKVIDADVGFKPVTLVLETPGEVRYFRDMMGATPDRVDEAYGNSAPVMYGVYNKLDELCETHCIPKPNVTINIDKD